MSTIQNNFVVYDYIQNGVFVLKDDFSVVYWNKALEEISEVSRFQILGVNILEYFPHLNKNIYRVRIENIFKGGPPEIFSSQLHKYIIPCDDNNGSYRIQEATAIAFKPADSESSYAVFTIKDLTEERNEIMRYRDMRDMALQEIAERAKIEEKLKEINISKDKFFSIMAHDIKSPLNAIIGYSEILTDDYEELSDAERLEFIAGMRQVSKNMYNLLENILQWSRIQTGRIEYNPEEFELKDLADDVLSLMSVNAKNKSIELNADIPPDLTIVSDKNMLHTVFRNLVSNAIKFTNRSGVISISAKRFGDETHIEITDNGVGMNENQLDGLFRIEKTSSTLGTDREEGTGLGLVLCKELVEKNGGNIKVKSSKGEGTKFILTFSPLEIKNSEVLHNVVNY